MSAGDNFPLTAATATLQCAPGTELGAKRTTSPNPVRTEVYTQTDSRQMTNCRSGYTLKTLKEESDIHVDLLEHPPLPPGYQFSPGPDTPTSQ